MRYQIDTDILNNTTKCTNDFSCLLAKKDCLCEVEECIKGDGGILFIKPLKNVVCDYRMPLGESWLCECPTREAIYRQYGT
jgi:hypothetical protein